MRPPRAASTVVLVLALAVQPARGDVPPLAPDVQAAVGAYLTDPVGTAQWFLETARAQIGPLHPAHAILLGDAALRTGRYRWATEYFESVREGGQGPALTSTAEIGLAWAALGRGRLADAYEHFANAGALNEQVRSLTDFAMALVAAADGAPDGPAALAAAAARAGLDPAFGEIAPLLDGYARLWAGDTAGAADAFTAFAVAHPDSRFADDALYAAAQAKQELGRADEAQADLEALAGDGRVHGRLSSRLGALDGRALLREGMRRDREMNTRLMSRRIADLLDGDGGRLARAALAARARRALAEDGEVPPDLSAHRSAGGSEWSAAPRDGDPAHAGQVAPRQETRSGASTTAAAGATARAARFPWTIVLAVAALLVGIALWVFARDRDAPARSR